MKAIFTLIFTSLILTFSYGQSITLSLNLEKGQVYKQLTHSESNITQEAEGQKMDLSITMNGSMSFLVDAVNESGYDMQVSFDQLAMSIKSPQGSMEFSSEKNDDNDVFSKILSAVKNKTFDVSMSKTGMLTEVKNVDALWESAINQFDEVPAMQREQIRNQLMNAYGAKALKGNIQMVTAIYPDAPVKKGEQWTVTTDLESGMSADVVSTYELTGTTGDYVLINGTSILETADNDSYVEANGMPMRYDLSGTMTSDIKVDRTTGWIVEATVKQNISGDVHIKANPQVPDGMKMPMTISSEMKITN